MLGALGWEPQLQKAGACRAARTEGSAPQQRSPTEGTLQAAQERPNTRKTRAKLASSARWHPEATEAARLEHRAAMVEEYIDKLVASAPPLDDATRARLAALLRPSAAA